MEEGKDLGSHSVEEGWDQAEEGRDEGREEGSHCRQANSIWSQFDLWVNRRTRIIYSFVNCIMCDSTCTLFKCVPG